MEFEFVPFVGALPITFGMTSAEVEKIIGPADDSDSFPIDDVVQEYRSPREHRGLPMKVLYDKHGKVAEVMFQRGGVILKYKNVNLFDQKNLIDFLSKDDDPEEMTGSVLFPKLGISTENSKKAKTIGIARKDRIKSVMADHTRVKQLEAKLANKNFKKK